MTVGAQLLLPSKLQYGGAYLSFDGVFLTPSFDGGGRVESISHIFICENCRKSYKIMH